MKRYAFVIFVVFAILVVITTSSNNATSQNKSYIFTITRADMRLLDDVPDGVEIEVTCQRKDLATGRSNTATVSGYISKTEFAKWPPSLSEFRTYLVSWLKVKVRKQRRVDWLAEKADLPVISNQSISALLGRQITIVR